MMLGGPMPIRLPYSADESILVTRRQNKLARDIDIINQKIRNNVLSRSEGATRIRFKQSEIDELQRYKSSKRVPTGRLSPAPRRQNVVPRKGKPANKYNPYAEDKVNRATGPNVFEGGDIMFERASPDKRQKAYQKAYQQSTSWTEDDRAGFTSRGNDRADGKKPPQAKSAGLNPRGLLEADYYVRFLDNFEARNGKAPNSFMRNIMERNARSSWRANKPLPAKVKKPVEQQVKETVKSVQQQAQSVADKAKDKVSSWFSRAKSSSSSSSSAALNEMGYDAPSTKTIKDNPYGKSYGSTLASWEKSLSKNKAKKYGDTYYGPKFPTNAKKWEDWNTANGIAGFAGMPNHLIRNKSRALRDTALMRKRAGARINFDNPNMTNNTKMRSWETYAKPEDVAMIKSMIPEMTGLEKFPELTPAGNAMMVELASHNNDPKKMELAANKLATDLMNKSGYFVKQYSVKVDPLQRKVKISEMSNLAGGLSKTRNSMQRLLK